MFNPSPCHAASQIFIFPSIKWVRLGGATILLEDR
jgi:hypothetical protein